MDQGLADSRLIAAHLARFFIGLEFGLGLLLLFPFYTRKLVGLSLILLFGFTVHLLYLWSIGETENCGCFGEMISMTPIQSVAKNIFLIALGIVLFLKSTIQKKGIWVLSLVFFFVISSQWLLLPIPNHNEHSFSAYTHFEKIGRVDILSGEKWIAVFNLDCEHCQDAAAAIGRVQKETGSAFPQAYALYFMEGGFSVEDFEEITQAAFPYAMIEINTFFNLIGDSPPRLYKLMDGKIQQYWDQDLAGAIRRSIEKSK